MRVGTLCILFYAVCYIYRTYICCTVCLLNVFVNKLVMIKMLVIVTNTLRLYITKEQHYTAHRGKYKMGGIDIRMIPVQGEGTHP